MSCWPAPLAHHFGVSCPQIKAKYNSALVDLFRETFCWLPLAHLLSKKVLSADLVLGLGAVQLSLLLPSLAALCVTRLKTGRFARADLSIKCRVQVLVVHGGLFSRDGVTLDDIRAINRNMCARCDAVSIRLVVLMPHGVTLPNCCVYLPSYSPATCRC